MKVGESIGHSFAVTDKIYQGFIDIFDDRNPMHVNDQYAIDQGYKSAILHGNILNGFLSYFVGECLPQKNVVIISQKISYHNPFFVGDQLRLEAKLKDMIESVNVQIFKYVFKNEADKLIAKGEIQVKILK